MDSAANDDQAPLSPSPYSVDFDLIRAQVPVALRDQPQWVAWGYEERDGHPTKVPVNPLKGVKASTIDPGTWATFDQSVIACARGGLDGIGFVLTADDPYCGIDLDGCIVNGQIVPEARAIIDDLDSYAEISPSGAGVKLFIKATKPSWAGCKSKKVSGFKHAEIYDSKRFFTVTGDHIAGTSQAVEERQEPLKALCERFWPQASPTSDTAESSPPREILEEALPKALTVDMESREQRCLAYVAKCPDAVSGNGGHDSTLRAACECFRFGLDESAAWRVMRWFNEKKTNGEQWTDKELNHKLESARKIVESAGEFGARLEDLGVPASSMSAAQIAALMTDVGNAARLVQRFGHKIRYCHGMNQWLIWDGRRWKRDEHGRIVKLCKQTALAILDEAKRGSDDKQDKLIGWAMASQKRDRLMAMAALAQPDVAVAPDDLDADRWAFNCLNGTIDLRTGALRPHQQLDLITKLAPVEYDPEATCPRFDQFLEEIFTQDELITFVQRLQGMCLTGDVTEQLMPIYYGQGNNGKNVLLDTITSLMGEYASESPPDLLTVTKHREHPTEIADLCGRRLVIASESEEAATLRLQLVKRLTGNARLKGRFMRKDYFEFPRTHKLIMVTNNQPIIRENSEAAWRRIRLVPFNVVIPPDQRDPNLLAKLVAEWSGILAWLVRGCLDWLREGLGEPAAVTSATSDYRCEQDFLSEFFADRCVFQPQAWASRAAIFAAYQEWSQNSGDRQPLDRSALFGRLRRREGVKEGNGQEHNKSVRGFRGIGLQVQAPNDFETGQE
ncbi:MAG TPA: phage/plasmid primase, P4 family [Phycisphaerae bacterium]|nr:phage/plasmid primase, P4 family [Phycisphaerae bacterium]